MLPRLSRLLTKIRNYQYNVESSYVDLGIPSS